MRNEPATTKILWRSRDKSVTAAIRRNAFITTSGRSCIRAFVLKVLVRSNRRGQLTAQKHKAELEADKRVGRRMHGTEAHRKVRVVDSTATASKSHKYLCDYLYPLRG